MSNTLHFDLRVLERSEDDLVIMVPHEDAKWGTRAQDQANTNQTRQFCNWIRKQFPHIPTEFRFVNKRYVTIRRSNSWSIPRCRLANCDKHFVAYGLTRAELMIIKLSWIFKTQKVELTGRDKYDKSTFVIPNDLQPSSVLKERMEKKVKFKAIDEL